jgi:hypothetical protein
VASSPGATKAEAPVKATFFKNSLRLLVFIVFLSVYYIC